MDEEALIQAYRITSETIHLLAGIYQEFGTRAKSHYRWDLEPIPFEAMSMALTEGILSGYLVSDTSEREASPIGFMLYRLEEHRAIEVNVLYIRADREADRKIILDRVMPLFIEDIKAQPGWDVVSFALLGEQEHLIRSITWYGFKPIGQAILKFDLLDPLTLQIMKQQSPPALPEGYRLDHYKPEYAGGIAETLYEAFSRAPDALWDPRFRSLLGTRKIVAMLSAGEMGTHLPECTSVVLYNDTPVGVCYLVHTGLVQGNIPLVGIHPSAKGKGLGNRLLKRTLDTCLSGVLAGRFNVFEITATMETDNIPALKMYRRMGFREEYNYPHVYLPVEVAQKWKAGKWC